MTAFCYRCGQPGHVTADCPRPATAAPAPSLFDARVDSLPAPGRFDGETVEPAFDAERLGDQAKAVYRLMADGDWTTLRFLADQTGFPETSISARLRDLRKPRFGGFDVVRRRIGDGGEFEYRIAMTGAVPDLPVPGAESVAGDDHGAGAAPPSEAVDA